MTELLATEVICGLVQYGEKAIPLKMLFVTEVAKVVAVAVDPTSVIEIKRFAEVSAVVAYICGFVPEKSAITPLAPEVDPELIVYAKLQVLDE